MKLLALLATLTFSLPALAHVKIGEYKGQTPQGTACSFRIESVSFDGGVHHPLNERVTITVEGETFTLSHPPHANEEKGTVDFNHDLLSGARGRGYVYMVALLKMEHSETKDGPSELVLIRDDKKAANIAPNWVCGELVAPQGM